MRISDVPFHVMDWATVEQTNHRGASGEASWRTRNVGPGDNPIRLRLVEYSPGYVADHWCEKGHVLFVLEGQLETRLKDGRTFTKDKSNKAENGKGIEGGVGARRAAGKGFRGCARGDRRRNSRSWGPPGQTSASRTSARWTCLTLSVSQPEAARAGRWWVGG
jgi:hypothetical protein